MKMEGTFKIKDILDRVRMKCVRCKGKGVLEAYVDGDEISLICNNCKRPAEDECIFELEITTKGVFFV
jgi:hypothetical protein